MGLLEITEENLNKIEQEILQVSSANFDSIYFNDEYLFKLMELTKNKQVFLKCIDLISVPFLAEKVKSPEISQEMIFKLTLHPSNYIKSNILKRDDVTPALLKQMIENFKDEKLNTLRPRIIRHKVMDEETLYDLCNYDNNQILSQVLLAPKVSRRIIKKLQNSSDDEIRTMAEVRDPETDPKYIEKILKREFRKALRVEEIYSNKPTTIEKEIIISDILEAGIRNPSLPTELVELYKKVVKPTKIALVIPHPNISQELLDFYYKNGDEDIKEAVLKRNKQKQSHEL